MSWSNEIPCIISVLSHAWNTWDVDLAQKDQQIRRCRRCGLHQTSHISMVGPVKKEPK